MLKKSFTLMLAFAWSGSSFALMNDSEALQAVEAALADGQSADAIIEMLVEDGRSLADATALAVGNSAGQEQVELARAGICAALDNPEAEQVGQAALGAGGGSQPLEDEIESLVALYAATQCQAPPETYRPAGAVEEPGGGTPSRRGVGGRPPTFPPTRPPPVSPAS